MKSLKKILSIIVAAVLVLSIVGCTPVSLSKQWSYEYNDSTLSEKLDIGVYIYALYDAYTAAESFAQESDKYVDGESFMDIEITDDDGNKAIAKDWIKSKAEEIVSNLIAIDYLVKEKGAKWDATAMANAEAEAKEYWDIGYVYGDYYQIPAQKKTLEPYGISFESFLYVTNAANVKQTALFGKLYDKGGLEEVADDELTEYFTKEYLGYSYLPIDMYTSETQDDGTAKSTPFAKDKINSTKETLEGYAQSLNDGSKTLDDVIASAVKEFKITKDNASKDNVSTYDDAKGNNEDVAKAVKKLDNNQATVITVGEDGDAPVAYLVVKHDIKDYIDDYIKDDTNRANILSTYKAEEFQTLVDEATKKIQESDALIPNTKVLSKYDPKMFFVKSESTDSAEAE